MTSSRAAPRADTVDKHSLAGLAGVGPATAAKFAELGIDTPEALLAHLPRAYRDWRVPQAIATLTEGEAIVVGRVIAVKERSGRFPLVTVTLADDTGTIAAKFFGRRHLFGRFAAGDRLFVSGRVTRTGLLPELNVTAHRELRADQPYVGEIVPVYGATKDLPSRTIRTTIAKNLDRLVSARADALPPSLARKYDFPPLREAWYGVHAPRDARRRRARARPDRVRGILRHRAGRRAQARAPRGRRRRDADRAAAGLVRAVRRRAAVRADRRADARDRADRARHAPRPRR